MYSVSQTMPLESFQIIQPSDNQTDFIPGQVIRFRIPRSTGFFDSHLSKIQFNVRTEGANYKMCFNSPYAGMASMIDMVRISQNGKVIGEILDYNQLQHFIKGYELSLSGLQREAVGKGLVDYAVSNNTGFKALSNSCLVGQGVNRSGADGADGMEQDVKFQMSLDFVSLFEILEIVPCMVLGDLLMEVRIAPRNEQILKVLPATGIAHTCSNTPAAGNPLVVTLTPPFVGFTCLADSPFIVGQSVAVVDNGVVGANHYAITALSQAVQTGVITLTTATNIVAGDDAKTSIIISKGADGNEAVSLTRFVVSKSELQLQVVKPPTQYVADIVNEAERGEMFIDVDTYTTYRSTVLANIKNQTITIPTTQSRVKSFFTVPRRGNQSSSFSRFNDTDFNYDGVFGDLRHYRSQIDGVYYPNTPIELAVMIGGWHFSAEHLRELEKAFDASGCPIRSLLGMKQNFVIGRALSSYGSSTNLTGTPINLYLEYESNGPSSSSYPNATASVTEAGEGYTTTVAPALVSPTGGTGQGMKVKITANTGAGSDPFAISNVEIVEQGSGYSDGDVLTIPGGSGGHTVANIVGGTGYTNGAQTNVATTSAGDGEGLRVNYTGVGNAITAVVIVTTGSGYSDGDTLTVAGGNGGTFRISVSDNTGRITLTKSALTLDTLSFVHHTNRIAVSPMGLEVLM